MVKHLVQLLVFILNSSPSIASSGKKKIGQLEVLYNLAPFGQFNPDPENPLIVV